MVEDEARETVGGQSVIDHVRILDVVLSITGSRFKNHLYGGWSVGERERKRGNAEATVRFQNRDSSRLDWGQSWRT